MSILKINMHSVIWQRLLIWQPANNNNKRANNTKYSNCKVNELAYKICDHDILNCVSTLNFISIYYPSFYKLSKIPFVH